MGIIGAGGDIGRASLFGYQHRGTGMFGKRLAGATLAALLLVSASSLAQEHYGAVEVARVTSVYDGDTFRADLVGWPPVVGERMPVRLKGVDTPELRGDCQAEKEAARAAKRFTVAQLRGAEHIELREVERGKYFRLVAAVYVDGQALGAALLQAGLARPYEGGSRATWC